MFSRAEAVIKKEHTIETKRIFVVSGLQEDGLNHLAGQVIDTFAHVTGNDFESDRRVLHSSYIASRIAIQNYTELRLGIPRLRGDAREHGKLWSGAATVILAGEQYDAAKFWVDTNDSTRSIPLPPASQELITEFDDELKMLADKEFGDITIPIPEAAFNMGFYNPAV